MIHTPFFVSRYKFYRQPPVMMGIVQSCVLITAVAVDCNLK